jgi:hypothetical protein
MNMKLIGLVMVSLLVFGLGVGGALYTLGQQDQVQPLVKISEPTPVKDTTPTKQVKQDTPVKPVKQEQQSLLSETQAVKKMNAYLDNHSTPGMYSVNAPSLISQDKIYHATIYGPEGAVGYIQIDSHSGKVISSSFL